MRRPAPDDEQDEANRNNPFHGAVLTRSAPTVIANRPLSHLIAASCPIAEIRQAIPPSRYQRRGRSGIESSVHVNRAAERCAGPR
jgi:hypothetical protein